MFDTEEYEKFQLFLKAYQDVPSEKITKKVIKKGNLNIIKLLHEKNAIFPDNGLQIAAKHGHLELVKWFLNLIVDKMLENAIDSRNMELVGWLLFLKMVVYLMIQLLPSALLRVIPSFYYR